MARMWRVPAGVTLPGVNLAASDPSLDSELLDRLGEVEDGLREGAVRLSLASLETVAQEAAWQHDLAALAKVVQLADFGCGRSAKGTPTRLRFEYVRAEAQTSLDALRQRDGAVPVQQDATAASATATPSATDGAEEAGIAPRREARSSAEGGTERQDTGWGFLGAVALYLGWGLFFAFVAGVAGTSVFNFDSDAREYLVMVWALWSVGLVLIVVRSLAFRERFGDLAVTAGFWMAAMVFPPLLLGLVSRRVRTTAGLTVKGRPQDR